MNLRANVVKVETIRLDVKKARLFNCIKIKTHELPEESSICKGKKLVPVSLLEKCKYRGWVVITSREDYILLRICKIKD